MVYFPLPGLPEMLMPLMRPFDVGITTASPHQPATSPPLPRPDTAVHLWRIWDSSSTVTILQANHFKCNSVNFILDASMLADKVPTPFRSYMFPHWNHQTVHSRFHPQSLCGPHLRGSAALGNLTGGSSADVLLLVS